MSSPSDAGSNDQSGPGILPHNGRTRTLGTIHRDAVQIQIRAATLDEILEYSEQDTTRELGGFLFGHVCGSGRSCVSVEHFLPAMEVRSRAATLTFTHETWATLNREAEQRFPEAVILGWYHTHPNLGVFLSAWDRFIHRHFFRQPWHIALVVDPVQRELGFFQWRAGNVVDCGFLCLRE